MSFEKRKYADFDGSARSHGPSKKSKVNKAKPDNMPWVKKRARTIERTLRTSQDLPANVQNEMERELEHHKRRIAKAAEDKQRKDMISKYHMVRFFERKKADRLAKRLRTQLEQTADEAEKKQLADNLRTAEIDGVYARFFPHRERYISLYPPAGSEEKEDQDETPESATSKAVAALNTDRPPIWYDIERAERKGMAELVAIRERMLNPPTESNRSQKPSEAKRKPAEKQQEKQTKPRAEKPADATSTLWQTEVPEGTEPKNRKERRALAARAGWKKDGQGQTKTQQKQEADDDSDGGFFE